MKITRSPYMVGAFSAVVIVAFAVSIPMKATVADGQETTTADNASIEAVEDDMHEFMEYVFQPTYKRLKDAVAVESKDNATWKIIKSDALILAESGNLLLGRSPESDAEAWIKTSVKVREHGGQLYRAAKAKDPEAMQAAYLMMIENCNACHQKYSAGDPQLKP